MPSKNNTQSLSNQWSQETKKLIIRQNPSFDTFEKLQTRKNPVVQHSVIVNAYEQQAKKQGLSGQYSSYANQIYGMVPTNKYSRLQMYRNMALYPEVADALDEICEAASQGRDETGQLVTLSFQKGSGLEDCRKDTIREEFERFISLFEIDSNAFEYFYHLCTDGEMTWENVINQAKASEGIIGVSMVQPETYEYYINAQGKKTGVVLNSAFNPVANYANPINIGSPSSQYNVGTAGGYQPQSYSTATSENTLLMSFKQITHICTGTFDHTGLIVYPPLEKARVAYRQLSTIEAACIIYRLVRAPERLVFNVDTGSVSPTRAEQMVNKMMERFNVKHVWDAANGTVATNYDPMSMMECLDLSTKIPLLDGRTLKLSEIIEEFKTGEKLWAYSCDPKTGQLAMGKISWAGITRKNAKVVRISLNNGEKMVTTPDHRFPVYGKGKVEAKDLVSDDRLFRFDWKVSGTAPATVRVVSVEELADTMDTGTLTIDQDHEYHDYHTFATAAAVYTCNSFWFAKPAGSTGTDVQTLTTGQNLGQLDDLYYFQKKLYTSLKVPWSRRSGEGGQSNGYNPDQMTPEEERFLAFVMRIQSQFAKGLMASFRTHLELRGLWDKFKMNGREFMINFCPPTTYEIFRRQKMLDIKMSMYSMMADRPELSKEDSQREFLGWDDQKIQANKAKVKAERLEEAQLEWMIGQMSGEGKEPGNPYDAEPEPLPPPESPTPDETMPPEEGSDEMFPGAPPADQVGLAAEEPSMPPPPEEAAPDISEEDVI